MNRRTACSLTLVALIACGAAPTGVGEVSQDRVLSLTRASNGPLLLDVRTPDEFAAGHVPGARNIPHSELAARMAEVEPFRERGVIVYCESGRRAGMATADLTDARFRNVSHLMGDMSGWRDAGLEIER